MRGVMNNLTGYCTLKQVNSWRSNTIFGNKYFLRSMCWKGWGAHTHSHRYTHYAHTHACTHTHAHTQTHTHTHTHTKTHPHAHAHTHTHTHTHIVFSGGIIVFTLYIRVPGPEVIKRFSCSTQLNMKFVLLINLKILTIANSFLLNIAEHENFSATKNENANHCCRLFGTY